MGGGWHCGLEVVFGCGLVVDGLIVGGCSIFFFGDGAIGVCVGGWILLSNIPPYNKNYDLQYFSAKGGCEKAVLSLRSPQTSLAMEFL